MNSVEDNMNTKKMTLREFLDAMEKNGYPKARGGYIFYVGDGYSSMGVYDRPVAKACAFGQAALNLKIPPTVLETGLSKALHDSTINHDVVNMNDTTGKTVTEIAQAMKEKYADKLDTIVTFKWIG